MGRSIGLLGGSFNPPHVGHVRLAVEALEQLGLDRVDLVVSAYPPHKPSEGMLDFASRLELARRAVAGIDGLAVSAIEAALPAPSFTQQTLAACAQAEPGARLVFILGAPDMLTVPSWQGGLSLLDMADFAVAERLHETDPGSGNTLRAQPWANRLRWIHVPRIDVSATLVRERFLRGRRLNGLVMDGVAEWLRENEGRAREKWATSD